MYLKVHKQQDKEMVSLCDENLIGKTFEDGELRLNISKSFYKGDCLNNEEIVKILKKSNNLNIVGKNSIDLCLENGIIDIENISKIQNIPYALVFAM